LVGKERQTMDAHVSMPSKGFTIMNLFISHKTLFNLFGFMISIILYIILMCAGAMNQKEASKCLALLIFAALIWAFER
jgi:phosphate transporter